MRALKGGPKPGPSPVDRAKPGSKHHLITEAHGIPLAVSLTGGQRNDVTQLMPLINAVPPVRAGVAARGGGQTRVYADRGYDHDKYRRQVRGKGITPVIARRGRGTRFWPGRAPLGGRAVHRAAALVPAAADPLGIRDDIHEAFLSLACSIICWRRLTNLSLC